MHFQLYYKDNSHCVSVVIHVSHIMEASDDVFFFVGPKFTKHHTAMTVRTTSTSTADHVHASSNQSERCDPVFTRKVDALVS